jgi:HlyD family secretion protein
LIDAMTKPATLPSSKSSGRRRKFLPWIGVAIIVAAILAGLWPKPLAVETSSVSRKDLVVTVNEEGMTRVKNRYVISAPVSGQLQRIDWKAGANVVAGETVLAVLNTSGADLLDARGLAQAEARVKAAEANLDLTGAQLSRARAVATLAHAERSRLQALNERGAISQQEFESAVMRDEAATEDAHAAEFSRKIGEFELQQAQALLLRGQPPASAGTTRPLVITSPVNGQVLRVFQESTRVVTGGTALLEVGDPRDLEVRIEVLSRDGVAIPPGARVAIDQWGGEKPLDARVRLVEPSAFTKISALGVEEQRVYVVADFVTPVDQRATLGDSYRVEARIVTWENAAALCVPSGAIFQRGNTWQTFVLEGGHARQKPIEVGRTNGLLTEIVGGLSEGQVVIVYPGDKVEDGRRVRALNLGEK